MSRQSKALACGHAVCLIRIRNFLLDASLPRGLASLERVVCGIPLIEKDFVLTKFGEPLCSSNVLRVMASYGVLEILPNLGSATGASRVAVCSCARLALARHVKYIVGQCLSVSQHVKLAQQGNAMKIWLPMYAALLLNFAAAVALCRSRA